LELGEAADEKTIRKNYLRLSLKVHPDKNQGDPLSNERFTLLLSLYNRLS
jgi:curved DNA-binding protein CbpA